MKSPIQCQFAEDSTTIPRCPRKATRKWGDCWFCEEHGARKPAVVAMSERERIVREVFHCPRMARVAFKTRDKLIAFDDVTEDLAFSQIIERTAVRLVTSIRENRHPQDVAQIRRYSYRGEHHEGCPVFEEE